MKKIFFFLCFFIVFNIKGANGISPWEINGIKGKKASFFELKDLSGNTISLTSLAGKVILLNFWATWCPPCKAEMPSLNTLYNTYKDKDLVVLAISEDKSFEKVARFVKAKKLDFPVAMDNNELKDEYKVFVLPTSILISRDGSIAATYIGEKNWMGKDIRDKIEALLH